MAELTRREFGRAALVSGMVAATVRAVPALGAPSGAASDERLLAAVNPELRQFARPMLAWRTGPPLSQTYRDIRRQAASAPVLTVCCSVRLVGALFQFVAELISAPPLLARYSET